MTLTIQDLGALGELLGSVAVLVTLVYLAMQGRHGKELLNRNDKIALSQARQPRASGAPAKFIGRGPSRRWRVA